MGSRAPLLFHGLTVPPMATEEPQPFTVDVHAIAYMEHVQGGGWAVHLYGHGHGPFADEETGSELHRIWCSQNTTAEDPC